MKQFKIWAATPRSPIYQIIFSVMAIYVSIELRHLIDHDLPLGYPFLTFFGAVILTGFFASTLAGVAVAIVCGLAAWYWFMPPFQSFDMSLQTIFALSFYAMINATYLVLLHVMRPILQDLALSKIKADSLAQINETMFQELQHRVSNNLQVTSSLLKLQSRQVKDASARHALDAATHRVQAIAGIQRRLHDPAHQSMELGDLLRDVLPAVVNAAQLKKRVSLEFDLDRLQITGPQATPATLIVLELVSNAIEHGSTSGKPVKITVRLKRKENEITLSVQDNGPGLPPDFKPEQACSLGLRVAIQFSEQLGGHLRFRNHGGTLATLTFPLVQQWPEALLHDKSESAPGEMIRAAG